LTISVKTLKNEPNIKVQSVGLSSFHVEYTHAKMASHKRKTYQRGANNLCRLLFVVELGYK